MNDSKRDFVQSFEQGKFEQGKYYSSTQFKVFHNNCINFYAAISKGDVYIKAAKEAPIPVNLHEMVWGYIQLSNCYLNLKQIDTSFTVIEKAVVLASLCHKNNFGVKPLLECQSFKVFLYIQSNKRSEAIALAKMNLKFAEETLSDNNLEIVKPLMDLAFCQDDEEKTSTIQLLNRVLTVLDKVKSRHPDYCKASWRLVHIYLSMNEVGKGLVLAERIYNELTQVDEVVNKNPLLYGDGNIQYKQPIIFLSLLSL